MNGLSYLHLELTMHEEPRQPAWPADVSIAAFSHEYARATHDLLVRAYANGGGSVAGFDNWYNGLITDNEYDPELAVLVLDQAHPSVDLCSAGIALSLRIWLSIQAGGGKVWGKRFWFMCFAFSATAVRQQLV